MSCGDIFLGLIAILFPPIAVWIKCGLCGVDSIINIALCCLGYVPGLIHAWWIISRNPDRYEYEAIPDSERGVRVTHYYVSRDNLQTTDGAMTAQQRQHQAKRQPPPPPPPAFTHPTRGGSQATSGPSTGAGEALAPPTYADAIKGDNKVQTQN